MNTAREHADRLAGRREKSVRHLFELGMIE
jgi:hypothetical protein